MRLLNLQKGDKVDGQKEGHGESLTLQRCPRQPCPGHLGPGGGRHFSNIASDDKETGVALGKTDTLRDMRDTGIAMLENINKAAAKMGMKTVAEMLVENQKHLASLEADIAIDEAEQVEIANHLEVASRVGDVSLSAALEDFVAQRRLIVDDCNAVLAQAQEAIDSSQDTDEKLVMSIKSSFNSQTLDSGVSFFFESCNKQSGEARPGTGTGAGSGSGSGSGHQLAQVIGLSQITFQPANSELIMQLRRQRLLPRLPRSMARRKRKRKRQRRCETESGRRERRSRRGGQGEGEAQRKDPG